MTWHSRQDLSEAERRGGSRATETKFNGSAYAKGNVGKQKERNKKTPRKRCFLFCDKGSRRSFFEKKEQSCDVAQSAGFVRSGAEGREQSDRNKIQRLRIRERKRRQAKGEKQKNTLKEVFFCFATKASPTCG